MTESLELAAALRQETARAPDLLVVNALFPPPARPIGGPVPLWLARRRMQEEQLARLDAAWEGPRLELELLPLLPAEGLARELADRLDRALAAETGA